ncbi:DUF4439 domain-containing protein [Arthrobacter sp. OVS8]|nr:DUF4439 domain-containing protein [Arthrobacter sp. OVS8]
MRPGAAPGGRVHADARAPRLPAAGLGGLEASALTVYGDLVALSEGQTRQWAISGLVGAARRSALWGAETGALPGLAADPQEFPELPAPSPTPSP